MAHRPGVSGRAGDRACQLVDGEIVEGEPAGHGRVQWLRLDIEDADGHDFASLRRCKPTDLQSAVAGFKCPALTLKPR